MPQSRPKLIKTVGVMTVAVTSVTTGDIILSEAMRTIGAVSIRSFGELWRTGVTIFSTPMVWLGIFFLAVFLSLWMSVLSWADLTVALPLTALTYVLNALAAGPLLGEQVTWLRWGGTLLITFGVGLVSLGEARQSQDP